jgi:predicted ATP-dependent endonuclease of OLD family
MPAFTGLSQVRIRGFRSVLDVTLAPGPTCALVGEAGAGKSNILAAIWMLLSEDVAPTDEDVSFESDGGFVVEGTFGSAPISLERAVGGEPARRGTPPPAVFLPADARSDDVVAHPFTPKGDAAKVTALLAEAQSASKRSGAAPALALVEALEACRVRGVTGVVLLIEEPELFLRPQAQRYLHRLLQQFVAGGNQVIYSTHSPAFLNVAGLEQLALVDRRPSGGTTVVQPAPLAADESFRAVSEFDAERSELFLARAALLVEGRTEKLVFPLIFKALGRDHDREAISIVECGGKPNIPLFARICTAVGVPYLVVQDRDAPPGREPIPAERAVNAQIAQVAGPERTIVLEPDFEAVAGLEGRSHKPERAWRTFAVEGRPVPEPLAEAVRRVLVLAEA